MPNLKQYHVFISHSWKYDDYYDTIVNWLNDANLFSYSNYSICSEKRLPHMSNYMLEEKLSEQINKCSCVVVILGMYATYSGWMQYEIETAHAAKKRIIGIIPWGQEHVSSLKEHCDVVVGWNSSSLIDEIRKS